MVAAVWVVVSKVRFSCRTRRDSPCAEEGLRFLYDLKGESIIDSAHAALCTFRCVDTPSETVIAVVGDHMGVVAVVYDVAYFHAVKAGVFVAFEVVVALFFPQEVSFFVVGVVDCAPRNSVFA